MKIVSWIMVIVSVLGALVTIPLWGFGILSDRHMIGITLVLSWAALWYEAANSVLIRKSQD